MTKKELVDEMGFPPAALDHFTKEQLVIIHDQDPSTWRDSLPPNAEGGELHATRDDTSGFWTVTSIGKPDGEVVIEWGLEDPADAEEWLEKLWNHDVLYIEHKDQHVSPKLERRRVPSPEKVDRRRKHQKVALG